MGFSAQVDFNPAFAEQAGSLAHAPGATMVTASAFAESGTPGYSPDASVVPAGGGSTPLLQSITVSDATPTQMVFAFNMTLDGGSVPSVRDFACISSGMRKYPTAVSVNGSNVTVTWHVPFQDGETGSALYWPGTNRIRSAAAVNADPILFTPVTITINVAAGRAILYVDPATGLDANPGTQALPFKTIPGTRNNSDSGYLVSAWGSYNTGNKVPAGSEIRIKRGSTFNSATGVRWRIDGDLYAAPTAKNPTRIVVDDSWGTGSSVVFDLSGISMAQYSAGFRLGNQSSNKQLKGTAACPIHLQGMSGSDSFSLYIGNNNDGDSYTSTQTTPRTGNEAHYVYVHGGSTYGIGVLWNNNFFLNQCKAYPEGGQNSAGMGIAVGAVSPMRCKYGEIRDCETYGWGLTGSGDALRHGTHIVDSEDIWVTRLHTHNNGRDGLDFGSAGNVFFASAFVWGLNSHNNGEDGIGANATTTASGQHTEITVMHSSIWANGNAFQFYCGLWDWLYYNTITGNGRNLYTYTIAGYPANQHVWRNNYIREGSASGGSTGQIDIYDTPIAYTFDTNFNVWSGPSLTSNEFWGDRSTAGVFNYNTWPYFGASDVHNSTAAQSFVAEGSGNFRLTNDSGIASNKGTVLAVGPRVPIEALFDLDYHMQPTVGPTDVGAFYYV